MHDNDVRRELASAWSRDKRTTQRRLLGKERETDPTIPLRTSRRRGSPALGHAAFVIAFGACRRCFTAS